MLLIRLITIQAICFAEHLTLRHYTSTLRLPYNTIYRTIYRTNSSMSDDVNELVAADSPATVYRTFDDGYTVRSMRLEDAAIVQSWYCGMGVTSRYDLNTALQVFPASMRGFYIGEFEGRVVASIVGLPWADDVCYGSYYYVDKPYRTKGFGTRLRDEVAFEHVAGRKLCVDAVLGKVADTNRAKFGYKDAFKTGRFIAKAQQSYTVDADKINIVTVNRPYYSN